MSIYIKNKKQSITFVDFFKTETTENSVLFQSAGKPLSNLVVEGNSKQATYTGKNYYNIYDVTPFNGNVTITRENNVITVENKNSYTVNVFNGVNFTLPAGTYTVSIKEPIIKAIAIYNTTPWSWFANGIVTGKTSAKFTLTEEKTIQLYCPMDANSKISVINVMVEKGDVVTEYEPYVGGIPAPSPEYPQEIENVGEYDEETGKYKIPVKVNETTTNIYLNEPLRKIGDYADYIDYKNKKVVRYIKSKKLLSSDNWMISTNNQNGFPCYFVVLQEDSLRSYGHTICSHFKHRGTAWAYGVYGEYSDHPSTNRYYFITDKTTLEEWNEWIDTNDLIIDFILLTPTEEAIDVPEISTLKGLNYLTITTKLKPTKIKLEGIKNLYKVRKL